MISEAKYRIGIITKHNMKSVCVLLCIFYIVLLFCSVGAETNVELSASINPVTNGGILVLQCQIQNMQDGYRVMIMRRTMQSVLEQLTMDQVILPSTVSSRIFLSIRIFSGGSKVYFMTVVDVSTSDQGEYLCTVSTLSDLGEFKAIARDSATIQVYSFPEGNNPYCISNIANNLYEGKTTIELSCSSEQGHPTVELNWFRRGSSDQVISPSVIQNDQVVSQVEFTASRVDQNAVFVCEMISEGFPDYKRTCEVGPVKIIQETGSTSLITTSPTVIGVEADSKIEQDTLLLGDCNNECHSSSSMVFYLTVSTAAASLLCVIFFITTVIMCCKYHNKSNEARQRHEHIPTPPIRVADPNYRSLQRRTDNELVYMTLEDPNNPEGRVLLPKEVFDEFYNRTLTLQKK